MKPKFHRSVCSSHFVFCASILFCFSAGSMNAQTVILWNGAVNDVAGATTGDWSNPSNWTNSEVPDSITEQADLRKDWGGATANTPNITLGDDRTINGVIFDDTGATGDRSMTINAGNTLNLAGSNPVIQVDANTLTLANVLGGSTAWAKTGGGVLALNGVNTYTGVTNINAGVIAVGNNDALGSDSAGTVIASGATLRFAATRTLNEPLTLSGSGVGANSGAIQSGGGTAVVTLNGAITLAGDTNIKCDGGTRFVIGSAGITAAGKNLSFQLDNSATTSVAGPLALGAGGLTKTSGSTLALNGTNTYTGPTLIALGTIAVGGTEGSILTTSGITVSAGTLSLNNSAGNLNRVADTQAVNLTLGGQLSLVHNTSEDTTETIGAVVLNNGGSFLTVSSAADRVTRLEAATLTRGANRATALVRGTNLNQTTATNVSRIILADSGASLGLVGTNTLNNGDVGDATQALKIAPHLFGDSSTTGNGNGFVTYDATLGLRVLTINQTVDLGTAYTTAAAPDNTLVPVDTTLDNASGITINSMLMLGTAATTLNSAASNPLTINSGAIATSGNFAYTIGSGFSSIILGNGEGVITVPTNTLTIAAPISVTAGGGLTKAGANTLALTAANTYTGPTTINQGTLSVSNIANGGSPSALGASAGAPSNLVLAGGNLTYTGPTASSDRGATLVANGTINVSTLGTTLTLGGDITGTGILTKNGLGVLALNSPNTFTGNLTIGGTTGPASTGPNTIGNIVRLGHAEGLGPVGVAKTISMTGSNRQFSILELTGGITVDANKSISTAGKSFFASADSSFGSPVFLRNASGDNTWLGNVTIGTTGGAYSIESANGTLTLGSVGTSSILTQTAAADTRAFDLRGGGNFVIHSRLVNTGTSLINLQKMGTGTLTLSRTDNSFVANPNFFVGTTVVESMANGGVVSSIGAGNSFNLGGTLRHVGSSDSVSGRAFGLVGGNPAIESSGTGTLTLNSPTTVAYSLGAGTTLAPFSEGQTVVTALDVHTLFPGLTIAGNGIAVGSTIAAVDYNTRQITLDTPTVASSNAGLTSQGGANFATTAIAPINQAVLTFSAANAGNPLLYIGMSVSGTNIPAGAVISAIDGPGGKITLDRNITTQVASGTTINFNNNAVTISNTSNLDRTLTLGGSNTGDNLLGSPLVNPAGSGKLNLVKADGGKWILSGANAYSGTTTVNAGTLWVNGIHSGVSTYTVAAGATLGGTGSIASDVEVKGTLAPGAGIEDLATGTLGFANNSTLAIEINTSTGTADQVIVTGDVTTGGNKVNLVLTDLGGDVALANGAKLTLVTYSGVWAGTDILHFNGLPVPDASNISLGANTFTVDYNDGNALTLTSANAASAFQLWISSPSFGLAAADQDPTDDPDGDGVANLLEFALDGNPADAANNGKMILNTADSGDAGSDRDLTLTLAVRNGATLASGPGGSVTLSVDGMVYTIQGSADLLAWDKSVGEVSPAFTLTPAPNPGWTARSFQVTDSNTLPGKRFIRVGVQ
jgi:fibronectin-binding autotransporter adhesin